MSLALSSITSLQKPVSPLIQAFQTKTIEPPKSSSSEDKVTLSAAGLQASAQANPPLEVYAMPSWFMDFSAEVSNLTYSSSTMAETRRYTEFSEKLMADGHLSQADLQAMESYIRNDMPATQRRKDVEQHFAQHKNLYEEFGAIKNKHMQASLAEHGIKTQEDWQEKIMNQPGHNQELRMSIMQKMFNDPRAVELMQQLYINQPKV